MMVMTSYILKASHFTVMDWAMPDKARESINKIPHFEYMHRWAIVYRSIYFVRLCFLDGGRPFLGVLSVSSRDDSPLRSIILSTDQFTNAWDDILQSTRPLLLQWWGMLAFSGLHH